MQIRSGIEQGSNEHVAGNTTNGIEMNVSTHVHKIVHEIYPRQKTPALKKAIRIIAGIALSEKPDKNRR